MSMYYCEVCNKLCDNDYTPCITCVYCKEDVCLRCASEDDNTLCKTCADDLK